MVRKLADFGGFHGPLRRNSRNPRYFTDESGKAIYLTGSHTWAVLVQIKLAGDPDYNYEEWYDFMVEHNHNCMRLWTWDHPMIGPWTEDIVYFEPMAYARTGPGLAWDGKPKFDLSRFNEEYFAALRERVIKAGERGIYCAVMFFEGWCLRHSYPGNDAWLSHPYNINNNINGVNGDSNRDGRGDVYSLDIPEVVEYQKAYIRKTIDTVNDLDNVLYEIINEVEPGERSTKWQYHLIDYVHEYERTKPKQHPVGMTTEAGPEASNQTLFESPADWISPCPGENEEYKFAPPAADGSKVILTDTDHLWGAGGNYRWVWKSFTRGLNPLFMDFAGPLPGRFVDGYCGIGLNSGDYPDYEPLRKNLGYTRSYAERFDLNDMVPHGELASSGYCLAAPGNAYISYVPDEAFVWLDLSAGQGPFAVEWLNPRTGEHLRVGAIEGGKKERLVSPFGSDAVVALWRV